MDHITNHAKAPRLNKAGKEQHHQALKLGCVFDRRCGNHHLYYRCQRSGELVLVAGTPSDHRAVENNLARMRRVARGRDA